MGTSMAVSKVRELREQARLVVNDPNVYRLYRRAFGLGLALGLLLQCLICTIYPLLRR